MEDEKVRAVENKLVARRRAIIKGAECPDWVRARIVEAANFGDSAASVIVSKRGDIEFINSVLVGLHACLLPCDCAQNATQFTVQVHLNAEATVPLAPCYHALEGARLLLEVLEFRGVRFSGEKMSTAVFSVPLKDRTPIEVGMGIGAFRQVSRDLAGDARFVRLFGRFDAIEEVGV